MGSTFLITAVGAGESIPDAHITAQGVPSLKGSVHRSTFAATYFAVVAGEEAHIYLENHRITDFVKQAGQ
jgi:hypothetical protein